MIWHILLAFILLATSTIFSNQCNERIVFAPRHEKKIDRSNPWNDPFVKRLHDNIAQQGAVESEERRIEEKLRLEAEARRRGEEQQVHQQHVQQELFSQQMQVQKTYDSQVSDVDVEVGEWHELQDLYEFHQCGDSARLEKRIAALQVINNSGAVYGRESYQLSEAAGNLLEKYCYAKEPYAMCYGNQLQQVIHQECIDLLGQAANLPSSLPLSITPEIVVDCIEAAREYNQAGFVSKASTSADLCYAMIEYAKQVATKIASGVVHYGGAAIEGGVQGLIIAGQDIIDHPVQFALCAVAGEYVLAYQLSKVAWKVLDLAITAAVDPPKARETWDGYLASINGIIDAITSQEVTLRDAVKAGTALAVCWKAQSKLLKGCNKLCSGVKTRAVEYIKANPLATPEQYVVTPDGILMRAISNKNQNIKADFSGGKASLGSNLDSSKNIQWSNHGYKHTPQKKLSWKAVIKSTKHGDARYKHGLDIEKFERMAWERGTPTTGAKNWKVMKADTIIGATQGVETPYVRIEMSANTIHGHPITFDEYRRLLK